jgi:hypothetical protein
MTVCRECGGESQELILLGRRNYKEKCQDCGCWHYGGMDSDKKTGVKTCQKCGSRGGRIERKELDEYERLPSMEPCDKCKEFQQQAELHAKDGAIIGKCLKCHSKFVIKGDAEIAKAVRKQLGIEPPKLCGVELDTCVNCEGGASSDSPRDQDQA